MPMSELERRAQIEETWARRNVFADSMADERMAEYIARRDLARLGSYGFPEPAPPPKRPTVQPARGGFVMPNFPPRQVAIAHYARTASPDSMAALMEGLQGLASAAPAYAGRGEVRRERD